MKNIIVANLQPRGRVSEVEIRTLVEAQIENSAAVGWPTQDIVLVTNLAFDAPVTIVRILLNSWCLTGSKMFALEHLFRVGMVKEGDVLWTHDLDAWQNFWFDAPDIADIGVTEYSMPKLNGGSIFLRSIASDLIFAITDDIRRRKLKFEEPAINRILRIPSNASRVTVLNSTYNVGDNDYSVRYNRSQMPILVSHFHPDVEPSWRMHVCGENEVKKPSVSPRLMELLTRYYHSGHPLPNDN
jgi:hypothetical protein